MKQISVFKIFFCFVMSTGIPFGTIPANKKVLWGRQGMLPYLAISYSLIPFTPCQEFVPISVLSITNLMCRSVSPIAFQQKSLDSSWLLQRRGLWSVIQTGEVVLISLCFILTSLGLDSVIYLLSLQIVQSLKLLVSQRLY